MRFKLLDLDTLAMDHVEGRRQTGPIVDFVIAMALGADSRRRHVGGQVMLTLGVGKSYRRRDGSKDTIIENDGHQSHPFNSKRGLSYTKGGRHFRNTESRYDLVAEWTDEPAPTGPVRTVTHKKIVPGVYGHVWVRRSSYGTNPMETAAELRAAITTLTEIADALEARDG